MAYDPFRPVPVPMPEPVEGRTLPVYELEEGEEIPSPRPLWIRGAAGLLAALLTLLSLLSALDLGISPPRHHPAPIGH